MKSLNESSSTQRGMKYSEQRYKREIRRQFEIHLSNYLEEIARSAEKLVKVKWTNPERFEMLALYLCNDLSPQQISQEPGFAKDPSVIFRHIQAAARFLDVSLKKPVGRPPRPSR